MNNEYKIGGMTCESYAAKIKSALLLMIIYMSGYMILQLT